MSNLELDHPQRQSPVGVAVIFLKNLRKGVNIFISLLALEFGFKGDFLGLNLWDYFYIITFIFLVISYLQYRRFFFYCVDDKFVIEKGLLRRDRITIPFDRIQTVNLNQNVIQQLLKVIALKVDTAGSSGQELEISALPGSYARELQKFLIDKKAEHQEQDAEEQQHSEVDELDISEGNTPLIQLSVKDLMRIGLTENHLRTALIALAVVNGYLWQYEDYLIKPFEDYIEQQANTLLASWAVLTPIFLLAFIFVAVLISMIRSWLRYYNLSFFVDEKGLQLVSGLLKRVEYQVPVHKMQYIKWKSNPLRKLIGLHTLVVKQASSDSSSDRRSLIVPGAKDAQIQRMLDRFYPEFNSSGVFQYYRANRLLFTQYVSWFAVIPTVLILVLAIWLPPAYLVAGVYLPVAIFLQYRYWRSISIRYSEELLILRKGWLFPSWLSLKLYKIQDVQLQQSIFQRRRGLASLRIHTAGGDELLPHLPEAEALKLFNYILYKVESDSRRWM